MQPHVLASPGKRGGGPVGAIYGDGTCSGKGAGNGHNPGEIIEPLFGDYRDPLDRQHGPGIGIPLDVNQDGPTLGNADGRDARQLNLSLVRDTVPSRRSDWCKFEIVSYFCG